MTPDTLKAAIEEALKAQYAAGCAITRLSMVFDAVHPPKPETPPTPPEQTDVTV
jgi:hypothetical protein